jgi:hypothetical protein
MVLPKTGVEGRERGHYSQEVLSGPGEEGLGCSVAFPSRWRWTPRQGSRAGGRRGRRRCGRRWRMRFPYCSKYIHAVFACILACAFAPIARMQWAPNRACLKRSKGDESQAGSATPYAQRLSEASEANGLVRSGQCEPPNGSHRATGAADRRCTRGAGRAVVPVPRRRGPADLRWGSRPKRLLSTGSRIMMPEPPFADDHHVVRDGGSVPMVSGPAGALEPVAKETLDQP